MHAPIFSSCHGSMWLYQKGIRVKTFFNMLGPMVNPHFQKSIGWVFSLELATNVRILSVWTKTLLSYMHWTGMMKFPNGALKIISRNAERILQTIRSGHSTNFTWSHLWGNTGNCGWNFMNILKGNGTVAQNNVVCVNAGLAVATAQNCSLEEGFTKAYGNIIERRKCFKNIPKLQN